MWVVGRCVCQAWWDDARTNITCFHTLPSLQPHHTEYTPHPQAPPAPGQICLAHRPHHQQHHLLLLPLAGHQHHHCCCHLLHQQLVRQGLVCRLLLLLLCVPLLLHHHQLQHHRLELLLLGPGVLLSSPHHLRPAPTRSLGRSAQCQRHDSGTGLCVCVVGWGQGKAWQWNMTGQQEQRHKAASSGERVAETPEGVLMQPDMRP